MAFYDDMAEVSQELIQEFGRSLVIRRTINIAADPSTPWRVATSSTLDYPVIGIMQVMAPNLREGIKIERGDYMLTVAALDVPNGILQTDFVVDGDTILSIQNVVEVKPGPTSLVFKAVVRKWPPRSSS